MGLRKPNVKVVGTQHQVIAVPPGATIAVGEETDGTHVGTVDLRQKLKHGAVTLENGTLRQRAFDSAAYFVNRGYLTVHAVQSGLVT